MSFFESFVFDRDLVEKSPVIEIQMPTITMDKSDMLLQPYSENKIFFDAKTFTFRTQANIIYPWCPIQNYLLRVLVEHFNCTNWAQVASLINRQCPSAQQLSPKQCHQRWHRVCRPGLIKGKWSVEEDLRLYELLQKHPSKRDFKRVVQALAGRSDTQIHYRIRKLYPQYFNLQ
ncbi:Myb-like DNA-binding domain-containing protein [Spironucleus salmonicida]|uniref:Myb-like DNA-binding domain-containing protein n=1 Tax=Spironucleus salmonicida TaxID=348837 RepID=A0A9P8LRG8_9EUKA|nr:Myb-like DNA-binding domain-containing protein [Spironucleus salmonicida]